MCVLGLMTNDVKTIDIQEYHKSLCFRCFFLDKIKKKMKHHAPSDSMDVDSSENTVNEIDALINNCKFNMKLQMADSAWKQVKKQESIFFYFPP